MMLCNLCFLRLTSGFEERIVLMILLSSVLSKAEHSLNIVHILKYNYILKLKIKMMCYSGLSSVPNYYLDMSLLQQNLSKHCKFLLELLNSWKHDWYYLLFL